jgi:hypothetical protein
MLRPTQPRKRNYSRICSRPLLYCTPVRRVFLQRVVQAATFGTTLFNGRGGHGNMFIA